MTRGMIHIETGRVLAGITAILARQFDLPQLAVEFGAGDGLENTTTRYLIQHLGGWKGLWIEAHPETYSTLQQNIREDGRLILPVDTINVAISDRDGTAPFYCCTSRRRQGWSSLVPGDQRPRHLHKVAKYKKIRVECRRLPSVLEHRGEVGVMVCDIEEHDTVVIADMIKNTRIRPVVLMVEGNTPKSQQWQARLLDADYELVWNFTDGINRIYVRRGFLEVGVS